MEVPEFILLIIMLSFETYYLILIKHLYKRGILLSIMEVTHSILKQSYIPLQKSLANDRLIYSFSAYFNAHPLLLKMQFFGSPFF